MPSLDEVARTEFHSLELLTADAGIEYRRRIGASSGSSVSAQLALARQKLTTCPFVPSKIAFRPLRATSSDLML
jgi:hypothetical protein